MTFQEDLERLRRLYEARGFYHAEIAYDLALDRDSGLLTAQITVAEGAPIIVADIDVSVAGDPSFPRELPIATGAIFSEDSYQRGEIVLKQFYADQGHAFVESERPNWNIYSRKNMLFW